MVLIRSQKNNPRLKPLRIRRKRAKLSTIERKRIAQLCQERRAAFDDAMTRLRHDVDGLIVDGCQELDIDPKVALRQVMGLHRQAPRRSANSWNAYLRHVMKEVNEGMSCFARITHDADYLISPCP